MKTTITLLFSLLFAFSSSLISQERTISGKIQSDDGSPLIGASIYLVNTRCGTTTDENGEFELTLKEGKTSVQVSYIGFITEELKIKKKKEFYEIELKEDAINLPTVCVVANSHRECCSLSCFCQYVTLENWSHYPEKLKSISSKIKVYPNPTVRTIRIESDKELGKTSLLDNQGKLINIFNFGQDQSGRISLENLPAGIYYIHAENGNAEKVIKTGLR